MRRSTPGPTLKDIVEVLDDEPLLPAAVVELCRWVADYYLAGIGDALAVAMPPGARGRRRAFKTQDAIARRVTSHGGDATHASTPSESTGTDSDRRSSARRSTMLWPARPPACRPPSCASAASPPTCSAGSSKRGLVALPRRARRARSVRARRDGRRRRPMRVARADRRADAAPRAAVRAGRRAASSAWRCCTASPAAARPRSTCGWPSACCRAGRQVLLLVPEIALTPSVAALFRGAFGDRVAIQHSGLSDGERHDQWHRIRRGDVDVVVGTRSAVFAPLDRLGLIIVDEEHDSSYKQEETPRYHGRDVAIVRASRERRAGRARLGDAVDGELSERGRRASTRASRSSGACSIGRWPPCASSTCATEYADDGPGRRHQPRRWRRRSRSGCERREQVLVLLNRRGYATAVFCRQCGDTFECPNCSVSLTVHTRARNGWRARCHYCNYSMMVPKTCRKCAAPYLEHAGFGTEKVEQQLRELFPAARIGRVDRDTVRRKGALTQLLSRFAAGELDVLVGTQMIAKGHDFPRVTLVGVISADVGLGLADFRAAERTFQLLTQVAGRAGRGERAGRGDRADALSRALQHPARVPPGLPGVLRTRDRLPARDALSAVRRAGQRRRARAHVRRGDAARRARSCAGSSRRRAGGTFIDPRPGAGAARPPARRAPRAVLPERDAPRRHAQGADGGRRRRCRRSAGG